MTLCTLVGLERRERALGAGKAMTIRARAGVPVGRRVMPADAATSAGRAAVDVALVLAVDSSGSISEQRLSMQIQGYLDAVRHPSFIEAVHGGRYGRIALTFMEWTDARRQEQVVGWTVIDDAAAAQAF